jgi:hypothetical protein
MRLLPFSLALALGSVAVRCGGEEAPRSAPPGPSTLTAFSDARVGSDPDGENFQRVEAPLVIPTGSYASATLRVALDTTCFPFAKWRDDPPPAGQNWPVSCDAFDRNFELALDLPTKASEPPGLELVRAITPFGGPLAFEVDVTDVINARQGERRLSAHIATWSDAEGQVSGSRGGWNLSAAIDLVPGDPPRPVLAALPLYYDSQTVPELPESRFTLPDGTQRAELAYRVTGHGGATSSSCGRNPAEEFCRRAHALYADGEVLADLEPWRDDCADLCTEREQPEIPGLLRAFTYCAENPCGALASVRAPRANWCPGSVTPPFVLESARWNTPGEHQLRWNIADVAEGGSWRVSATIFAYGAAR